MHGNFIALLLLIFALVLLWLAYSGNYRATLIALGAKYRGGGSLGAATTPGKAGG